MGKTTSRLETNHVGIEESVFASVVKKRENRIFPILSKSHKSQTASAALDKIRIRPILRNLIVRKKFARMGEFKRGRKIRPTFFHAFEWVVF